MYQVWNTKIKVLKTVFILDLLFIIFAYLIFLLNKIVLKTPLKDTPKVEISLPLFNSDKRKLFKAKSYFHR